MDTSLDLPFDILLTKVDLEYGIYGLYNFYKMQIIQEKGKDLILLFTRWGRIGDIGQYQKTPFATLDEAIKEFKKVFKAKSGNNWENVKQFNAVPKKYRLVDLKRRVRRKEKQYKIDVKKAIDHIESKLPEPLFELMKTLISVNSAKDAFRSYGAVESSTPFGLLNCETLKKSQTILEQIEKLIDERENMKQKDSADFSKVTLEIIDLSEEFYHLIPVYGYQYERLTPLLTAHELRDKMELISNLLHFEFGVELLLAAQYRSLDVNPADYIYRCLGSHLQLLDRNEEETQLILQYIHNTGNKQIVKSIYRINRNGEEDNFIKNSVGNNWLLWHGTKVGSVLSILAKGLQIAPLSAEISGHLFGKVIIH
jgi:predicted DNA-binding WGR domain protein